MSPLPASLVLGVDVTTPAGGVALVSCGRLLEERPLEPAASPSPQLMPAIGAVLEAAGRQPGELTGWAVSVGPGSFTGTRVGLATLRALSHATGIPLAGVSTLEAVLATACGPPPAAAAWVDAGRGEVYARFRPSAPPGEGVPRPAPQNDEEERLARPADLLAALPAAPIRFCGSGALLHAGLIRTRPRRHAGDQIVPAVPVLAAAVAVLGERALSAGRPGPAEPRYIRPKAATQAQ
ncbi:MAG: tRNA (adenosine(37)-N6)-threonylcarbamoyltransferase complex dimerization subunit type 1 TsaB [Acidobacteriota bacterium]